MADKSVLEKYYDNEAKKRRAPTSKEMEQDAIEPDTTLEGLLIGPARSAAMGLKTLAKKTPLRSFETPKIGSKLLQKPEALERIARNKADRMSDVFVDTAEKTYNNFGVDMVSAAAREQARIDAEKNKYAKGGKVSSASSRADGCCVKGKTKGRYL